MRWWLAIVLSATLALPARAGDGLRELVVTVVGPDGSAPHYVFVDVECEGYKEGHEAPRGRLASHVPDKPCVVRASAAADERGARLPWAPTRVEVPAGETTVLVRMAAGMAVEGRVVDETGKPVPGITVHAAPPFLGPALGFLALAAARTDAEGRFRLFPLGEEPFDVGTDATPEFAASRPVRTKGGARDLTITVHRAEPIRLRVVDPSGAPVGGARVEVMFWVRTKSSGGATGGRWTTDAEGRLELGKLDPTLDLSLEMWPPSQREDLSSRMIDPWKPASGDLVLPPGFTAVLQVKDEEGKVVPAEVERLPTWEEMPGIGVNGKRTAPAPDDAGRVVIRHLAFGTHRFSARALGGAQVWPGRTRWVAVTEKQPRADLVIARVPRSLEVRVSPSEPGQTCFLCAENDGRDLPFQSAPVREDGVVRFSNLAQGDYSVYVVTRRTPEEGGRAGSRGRFTLDGAPVAIATAPGMVLRVRPRMKGEGAKVSIIWLYLNGHHLGYLREDADGTWSVGGLPLARYGLRASGRAGEQSLTGQAFAEPGGTVDLELVPEAD